jgi:class 3 adenylate cyclase
VIGDTVNTASRLQALAAPGEILITGALADDPAIKKAFVLEERGSVKIKGKETEIALFRVTYR